MTREERYNELNEKRYQLTIEMAEVERELLKYNGATLFVDTRKKRKPKPVTQSTQLPAGWWPNNDLLIQFKKSYPNIEIGTETEKFMNYYMSCGRLMKDWDASWRNWIIKASQFQEARQ